MAVTESDAYVKWAAWMLDSARSSWEASGGDQLETDLCLVDSLVSPSERQLEIALAGTELAHRTVTRHGLASLRRRVSAERPDVLLLALTGPTLAAVTLAIAAGSDRRPILVAGLPGVGLPVRERAVRARRSIDVFVSHSRRERQDFAKAFALVNASIRVSLASLPFLSRAVASVRLTNDPTRAVRPIVFAAQPSVPPTREERRHLLELLSRLGPPSPVVKLRQTRGERATHHEDAAYDELWDELVRDGRVTPHSVNFSTASLDDALDDASTLVTVSSTAALEAIAREVPVLITSDFGVSTTMLNEMFAGSGLFAPLTPAHVAAAGTPRAEWAADNYFHPAEENDWIDTIRELVEARDRSEGVVPPLDVDRAQLKAATRATARITVARALRAARALGSKPRRAR